MDQLTSDKLRHLKELAATDITPYAAAKRVGCSHNTARRRLDQFRGKQPAKAAKATAAVPAGEVEAMRLAAADGGDWEEATDVLWRRAEEQGARAVRRAREQHKFQWTAPGKHLLLAVVSDLHIAPGTPCDFKQMREDAELIRDTPGCYAVLAGDAIDNHIKHRAAVLAAQSTPDNQYKLFEHYLSILGPKLLVVTSGNHDDWTSHAAGVDVLARIVRDRRVCYAPDEAWLDITVGGQQYVVAVRHQYRFNSSFNQTHSPKQWLRLGPREFDIGVIGHHHEAAIEQTVYRDRFVWVARPGSYQITSGYARQLGYNPAIPTCPTFLLAGDEREITGWKSVRAMARSQRSLRELGAA